jgi:hypothetical protein
MRGKIYDNELTVTCLYNHIRMISEMNRDLTEANSFKDKCTDLEKKLGELKSQHRKEVT